MTLISSNWQTMARHRRWVMFSLITLILFFSTYLLISSLPEEIAFFWQLMIIIPFMILLFWLELGFFTALLGFFVLSAQQKSRHHTLPSEKQFPANATTAILLPIYNEDVAYVYAGLKSIYQSLQQENIEQQFEFYILSDSDSASYQLKEGAAWIKLCEELDAHGRIHYRHRKHRVKKKSGNIMDFCRRWGNLHPYMIVLDADSLMSGQTLAQLVSMMEQNPKVGLIQAPLYSTGIHSLFARSQQFVNRLYGPVFFAGLYYWWQGESQYWGHNVIIRTQAFMQHCDLPKLKEEGSLGGEILSHDFVEAALLNRAGWETWLAFELDGSFERPPPTLTDSLKRDRRWCQGNLQHWHIIWSRNIPHLQRFLLLGGIMSYVSSLVWLTWLATLSIVSISYQQLPLISGSWETLSLLVITIILLFVYKLFGILSVIKEGKSKCFSGKFNLFMGVIAETALSILIAPVKMFYYSRFILEILTGRRINWNAQQRTDHQLEWLSTAREYAWISIIGLIWGSLLLLFNHQTFLWMLPVLAGLVFSIPVAVLTSPEYTGKTLFTTPDDLVPTDILKQFDTNYLHLQRYTCLSSQDIFTRVLVDPLAHRQYIAYTPHRNRASEKSKTQRNELADKLLQYGPAYLSNQEYLTLLTDPILMCRLHAKIWRLPENEFQKHWAIRL
jgi:membrane glycosyltransferase